MEIKKQNRGKSKVKRQKRILQQKSQKQISNGSFSLTQSAGTICLKLIVFTQKHQCTYLHTFRQFPQKMVSIWNHLRF